MSSASIREFGTEGRIAPPTVPAESMVPSIISESNLASDFAYVNVLIRNDGSDLTNATKVVQNCEFNQQRTSPVLYRMEDFQLWLSRFKIPLSGVPLMVFPEGRLKLAFFLADGLLAPLVVTLTNALPANDLGPPFNNWIYSYTQFLASVNEGLRDLWQLALADPNYQAVVWGGPPPAPFTADYAAPRFELVPGTNFMRLVFTSDAASPMATGFWNPAGNPPVGPPANNDIRIGMSADLYYFFAGFSAKFYPGSVPSSLPDNIHYVLQPSASPLALDAIPAGVQPWPAGSAQVVCTQDYSSLELWQTLTRIVVVTSMPLEAEAIVSENTLGESLSLSVLTDFEVPQSSLTLREYLYLDGAAQKRFINFTGTGPLSRINLQVFFQTKDLQLFPLPLLPGFEANFKIAFVRRKAKDQLQYSGQPWRVLPGPTIPINSTPVGGIAPPPPSHRATRSQAATKPTRSKSEAPPRKPRGKKV